MRECLRQTSLMNKLFDNRRQRKERNTICCGARCERDKKEAWRRKKLLIRPSLMRNSKMLRENFSFKFCRLSNEVWAPRLDPEKMLVKFYVLAVLLGMSEGGKAKAFVSASQHANNSSAFSLSKFPLQEWQQTRLWISSNRLSREGASLFAASTHQRHRNATLQRQNDAIRLHQRLQSVGWALCGVPEWSMVHLHVSNLHKYVTNEIECYHDDDSFRERTSTQLHLSNRVRMSDNLNAR